MGEQPSHTSQTGESFDVARVEFAEESWLKVIAPVGLDQWQVGETFIEISLDSAQIDTKLVGQRLGVEIFTLVELNQHLSQAINKGAVISSTHLPSLPEKYCRVQATSQI